MHYHTDTSLIPLTYIMQIFFCWITGILNVGISTVPGLCSLLYNYSKQSTWNSQSAPSIGTLSNCNGNTALEKNLDFSTRMFVWNKYSFRVIHHIASPILEKCIILFTQNKRTNCKANDWYKPFVSGPAANSWLWTV